MATPQSHISYAPFGVGVMCAVVYIERGNDVYGWWTGARDSEYHTAYFKLEDFFSTKPTRFYATDGMDLYGGWVRLYSAKAPVLDKAVSIEDEVAHELDWLQDMFVAEWLFFADDPGAGAERKAYEEMANPLRHVNIRSKRLNRLDQGDAVWVHWSHDFNRAVLDYLQQHWPLDCRAST
jgi:hypothetical protein